MGDGDARDTIGRAREKGTDRDSFCEDRAETESCAFCNERNELLNMEEVPSNFRGASAINFSNASRVQELSSVAMWVAGLRTF